MAIPHLNHIGQVFHVSGRHPFENTTAGQSYMALLEYPWHAERYGGRHGVAGFAHGFVAVADDSSDRFGPALYARSRNSGRWAAISSRDVVRPPNATGVQTVDAAQSHLPADICSLTSLASSPPTRPQNDLQALGARRVVVVRGGRHRHNEYWVLYNIVVAVSSW